jgi:superfamily II DNA or RNA helicase
MAEIIIDNVYSKLIGFSKDIELKIWEKLSFEVKEFGCEYIQIRHLYNRKTKKTYTGLLNYVYEILEENNIGYKITDTRVVPEQNANFALQEYLTLPDGSKVELKARDYQQKIIDNASNREIVRVSTGGGKSIPLDTPILTPDGFVPLKDIHVGSIVFDENGDKTTVIGEYPQGEQQEYEIVFNDGTTIKCCKNHLWKFATRDNLSKNKWQVKTVEEILNNHKIKTGRNLVLSIPVCKPIQFEKKDLFLPPYLLGALLGDGGFSQRQITFTNTEEDVINKVKDLARQFGGEFKNGHKDRIQYTYGCGGKKDNLRDYIHKVFGRIKSEDKFIPEEYKFSDVNDRIALLQGLFDTDGTVNSKGHITYCSVSKRLVEDVQFLLNSLGYRAKIVLDKRTINSDRYRNKTWYIHVRGCDDKLFTSKKHTERFKNRRIGKNHHYNALKIVSITPLPTKSEMKCIAVDSPLHTFICKDFIVTHNTFIMAGLIDKFNVRPVSIFADKLTLCTQLKDEIGKFLGEEVGIVGGGINKKRDITVYSAQSTTEEDIKDSNMILFDECHHIGSNTFVEISKWAKNAYYRIGVSATPWREDGADLLLEAALDRRKEENDISASKLIEWGYLVPCTIYFIPYKRVFQGKSYNKVYKEAIANNIERNQIVVSIAVKMREVKHAPILILIQQVEHGETILKMLSKKIEIVKKAVQVTDDKTGKDKLVRIANVEFLSGKDDAVRRKAVIQGVRDGFVEILIGSTIADEGLDIPNLEILILAGGGRSSTRAFQRVGRVLRLYKNPETGKEKKRAIVFDFQDYTPMLRRHARTREKLYRTEEAWEIKKFDMRLLKK